MAQRGKSEGFLTLLRRELLRLWLPNDLYTILNAQTMLY